MNIQDTSRFSKNRQTTMRRFVIRQRVQQQQIVRAKNYLTLFNRLALLSLTTFYFGYSLVYISASGFPTLAAQYGDIILQPYMKGILIGSLTIGAVIGTMIAYKILHLFSRRKLTLMLCVCSLVIEILIQIPLIQILFICRSLQGILVGIFTLLLPRYIAELAPRQLTRQGIFGTFSTLFAITGIMFAFILSIILEKAGVEGQIKWRVIFAVNILSTSIVIICILVKYIPQSPNSLIKQGKQDEAVAVLALFYKKKYIQEVYSQKEQQQMERLATMSKIVARKFNLRTFLAIQLPIMQQLTGINAFVSQMGGVISIYQQSFGEFFPVLMGIFQFFAALYTVTCLPNANRRRMLLVGNFLMGLCGLGIGISLYYQNEFPNGFWVVVGLSFTYISTHGTTVIPFISVYIAQISPGPRAKYSPLIGWIVNSITIIIFPIINETFGYCYMFLAFGTISILLFILNYFIIFDSKKRGDEKLDFIDLVVVA